MSLKSKYQDFLAKPTTGALAPNAALTYIPTLTAINEPTAILKHYAAQARQIKKKGDKILSAIEGPNGLALETETTLEFLTGGGAYLPGLDDNFLTDKTVTFPIVHIVQSDANNAISSIRLHWDQGSLLKQVDVIGSRAKNWPIRDGKDQVRLIATTVTASPGASAAPSRRSTQSGQPDEISTTRRSHASSAASLSAMNDPKATLSLFESIEGSQEEFPASGSQVVSPRTAAKPIARDLADILAGNEKEVLPERRPSYDGPVVSPRAATKPVARDLADILSGAEQEPPAGDSRSSSPTKQVNGGYQRAGSAKNYGPIRLFQDDEASNTPPPKDIKTDPRKFDHFEFGEAEMPPPPKPSAIKKKHASQWDFIDFVTPEKPKPKIRTHQARNFSWSDEEEKSPVHRPVVHQPRPDAETHFEFVDDGTPTEQKARPVQKGRQHNEGLGLYKDNILGEEEESGDKKKKNPLTQISGPNVDLGHRHKDFDPQYDFTDNSPSISRTADENTATKKMGENKAKVLKGLNASWNLYDESPEQTSKKENSNPGGYKITTTGNGMGGRKDSQRHWGFGDDEDVQPEPTKAEKLAAAASATNNTGKRKGEEVKNFWDF